MDVHPFLCFRCPRFGILFFSVFSLQLTLSLSFPFPLFWGGVILLCLFSPSNPTFCCPPNTVIHSGLWGDLFPHVVHLGREDIFRFKSQPLCPQVATSAAFLSFPSLISFFSVFLFSFLTPFFPPLCFPSSVSASCSLHSQRPQKHHALL